MEHIQTGHVNNDFRTCLHQLMVHGMDSFPRPDSALGKTKELLNYNITLQDPRNRVITFPARNVNNKYLLAEFIWYANGSNMPDGILPFSKFWANITNSGDYDDYPKGTINSNYGNRLFGFSEVSALWEGNIQPINQWEETIALLSKDKDTRQAIMNIHVPSDRHFGNKDVPCTLTLQWFIREDALHLIVNMRSNDVILGFTNDVFQFTMLQEALLCRLRNIYPDLKLGHYFHNAGSMHIYDKHWDMAEKIIATSNAHDLTMIPMDEFNFTIATALFAIQSDWADTGMSEDCDFAAHENWEDLTPYWKILVKALFGNDHDALHELFGQPINHE